MPTRLTSVVIDSADPVALGRWWAQALGWSVTGESDDETDVGPGDDHPEVPELVFVPVRDPKVAQNRVHFDLASDSPEHQAAIVERLVAAGARPVDVGQGDVPWVVLADPEGNELCVLEERDRHRGRGPLASIVVHVVDVEGQTRFWSAASGWPVRSAEGPVASLENPAGVLPDLDLVSVPEPKAVKHRVHLDVAPFPGDDHAAEVARLEALGATRADVGQGDDVTWVVLADPEGGELCVLSPR